MKPLEGPVNRVGGMIDQVTDEVTNMVDTAEKSTLSKIGRRAKLMQAMGIGGQGSAGASGKGGNTAQQAARVPDKSRVPVDKLKAAVKKAAKAESKAAEENSLKPLRVEFIITS